jgi:hypothetical protein
MHGNATGIDGSYSRWSDDGHSLIGVLADITQKGGFAGSCLTGEKEVPIGLIYEPGGEVKEMVGSIGGRHIFSTLRQDKDKSLNTVR